MVTPDDAIHDLNAAAQGDDDAFGRVVVRYQDMAYACAFAYLGDTHGAQDASQEAFVVVYRELRAGKLEQPAAFPAWLKTIVRRQCVRLTRRKAVETVPLTPAVAAELSGADMDPQEQREQAAQQRSAMAAVLALPETYRLVTVLHYYCGYDTEQLAEILGLPLTTVKKRLHDARTKLAEWVGKAMSQELHDSSPSRDASFAARIQAMVCPEELSTTERLDWSTGTGVDVWEMLCACRVGDLERVKNLLTKDRTLVECTHAYRTPLHFAVRENHVDVAALLLEHGANAAGTSDGKFHSSPLDIARDRGYTQMQKLLETKLATTYGVSPRGSEIAAAIRKRDLSAVTALLDASPELLHAGDERTNLPIHWAVMTRQLPLIDELVARGADLNARRSDGARPIQLTNGDYHFRGWRDVPKEHPIKPDDVYRHLLKLGAYQDICTALSKGDLARVRALLDEDPSLANRLDDYYGYYACSGTALRNAAEAGHLEIVKLLLERGAEPNLPEPGMAPQGFALYSAATAGHFEIAQLLLERGANPNARVESSGDILSRVLSNKDQKMVELLCSYGAAQDLEILAYYGDVRTAAAMFAIDPSLADDPLSLATAAENGHEHIVRLMLRYQPDLAKRMVWNVWENCGKTPEINAMLHQHGMDPSKPTWLGITPLHRFASSGNVEKAVEFLNLGADLNAREDEFCSTPLATAARCGQKALVELLLSRGAKTNLPDDPAWATPLAWATRRGHTEIAKLLRQAGATA